MAVQSKLVCSVSHRGVLLFEAYADYHDDDFRTTNDDGDPDDFRVVRWYGTNHSDRDFTLSIQRGNGRRWADLTIPPGTFEQAAGGSVRYEFDAPRWEIS